MIWLVLLVLLQAGNALDQLSVKSVDKPFRVTVLYTPVAPRADAKIEIHTEWKMGIRELVVGNEISGDVASWTGEEASKMMRGDRVTVYLSDAFEMMPGQNILQVWVRTDEGYRAIVDDIEVNIQ